MFRYLVLGLLRGGAPQHGYALMKAYRERSGIFISNGNFYRELRCLVAEGLVRTAARTEGADARRSPYAISEDGADMFDMWLAAPGGADLGHYDDELSSRALFLAEADPSVARRMLDHWRDELWLRSKMLEREREAAMLRRRDGSFNALSMLLARRLKHIAADLEFIEELRGAYEQWLAATPPQPAAPTCAAAAPRAVRRRPRTPSPRRP
jgi:DNA-binding PadR family transcriptional regulator